MQGKGDTTSIEFTLHDPSGTQYSVHLSPADSPIDLKAYLSDFAPLSYYTNYFFESNSQNLLDYQEFAEQSVGPTVFMRLLPYTERSAKGHLKRLKDIFSHPPSTTCQAIQSTQNNPELDPTVETSIPAFNMESLILQPSSLLKTPSGLNPWVSEEEILDVPVCVQFLGLDEFNPPTQKRRMTGDLLYLVVRTAENTVLHITAAVNGFFINSSESSKGFKPDPASEPHASKTLPELLSKASAGFKSNFARLLNTGTEWNSIKNLPSVIPTPAWLATSLSEYPDPDSFIMRDWNEEFQMVKGLPCESPLQRIQRDKALGKIYSDFLEAAIHGGKSVINGCVQPLNPMDQTSQQLFVYNHIFFSFTEDLEYIVICKQSNSKALKLHLHTFLRT